MDEREKLQILIHHWIEHNREHAKEFRDWAGKARGFEEKIVGDSIFKAVERLEEANEFLLRAAEELKG